ncbi:MAG: 30S ribosomal protein S16 [Candidatus Latescibacteria bacterium]|nr:30S ribosomal protein S16 [Candidatus Latescibacterota bacterium]
MLRLRLARLGKKNRPFYRIVAMDINKPRNGKTLAQVGTYDPMNAKIDIDEAAASLWLDRGAQMSDTVKNLLKSQGILSRRQGLEGQTRADAISRDKPARRRKLGQAAQPEAAEGEAVEAPAAE